MVLPPNLLKLIAAHPRSFQENRYVYPVLSRRSKGISIGVNLNLDKVCNFDCVYCQVDRSEQSEKEFLDLDRLAAELELTIGLVTSGRLYENDKFCQVPAEFRRINDIALSGDGEPTTYRNFDEVAAVCADVRRRSQLDEMKLVLITNASMFDRERVQRGLRILDENNGEIWAKLDAGTEHYYRRIVRSSIAFHRILANLTLAACERPIVIQSLFLRIEGEPPSLAERAAYCDRLNEITAQGGGIKLVQIHTIARPPAEAWVTALSNEEVDEMGALVRRSTGLPVATFYG